MIDAELLALLRCPETRQEIRVAEPALIEELNRSIAAGTIRNRAGQPVVQRVEGGLVRADGRVLYPIWDQIPHLLIDEGIPLP